MNRLNRRLLQLPAKYPQFSTRSSSNASESKTSKRHPQRASPLIDEIIRINHAGELGADRIYAGQYAVLGKTSVGPTLKHMWEQEKVHRNEFEKLIREYRVRPTVMTPIWNVAGFALGAGTALLGEKAAMACTVAVETVIVEHYNDQLRQIMENPNVDKVGFQEKNKNSLIFHYKQLRKFEYFIGIYFFFFFEGTYGYDNKIPRRRTRTP